MISDFDMNEHLAMAIQDCDDAIVTKALDGTVLTWNPAAERMFGYSAAEMVGQKMLKIFPPERVHEEEAILARLAAGEKVDHFRTQRQRKDGRLIDLSVTISPVRDATGRVVAASKIARDISAQLLADRQIAQYKALIDSSEDGIVSKDRDGIIRTWNRGATRIFGHTAEQAIGQHVSLLFPSERLHEEAKLLKAVLEGETVRHFRTVRLRRDGRRIFVSVSLSAIHDDTGTVVGFSKIVRDLTQEIEQEQRLWQDVHFDSLTGLLSRQGLQSTVDDLIRIPLLRQRSMALVYLQLDGFAERQALLAPHAGDELLVQVAQTLKQTVREADEVARLHADRFGVLVHGFTQVTSISKAVEKIQAAVQGIAPPGGGAPVQARLGVAVYPEDGLSFHKLLKHAEFAAQHTQPMAARTAPAFIGRDGQDLPEDFFVVQALNRAIELGQLSVQYQPIVNAQTGKTTKAEALLRWHHPSLGQVPPGVFIPLAEKYGLIRQLSRWVLRQALQDLARWTSRFGLHLQVAVNRSSHDFVDPDESLNEVRDALHEFGLCGHNLILEITEHSLMHSAQSAEKILHACRNLGVEIAMDDFGTGYSALGYLSRYPVDFLKIDKSFVDGVAMPGVAQQLCEGIVAIAKRLDKRVVAEGVETAHQAEALRRMGAEFLQGYHFSRPLDADALEACLAAEGGHRSPGEPAPG